MHYILYITSRVLRLVSWLVSSNVKREKEQENRERQRPQLQQEKGNSENESERSVLEGRKESVMSEMKQMWFSTSCTFIASKTVPFHVDKRRGTLEKKETQTQRHGEGAVGLHIFLVILGMLFCF